MRALQTAVIGAERLFWQQGASQFHSLTEKRGGVGYFRGVQTECTRSAPGLRAGRTRWSCFHCATAVGNTLQTIPRKRNDWPWAVEIWDNWVCSIPPLRRYNYRKDGAPTCVSRSGASQTQCEYVRSSSRPLPSSGMRVVTRWCSGSKPVETGMGAPWPVAEVVAAAAGLSCP